MWNSIDDCNPTLNIFYIDLELQNWNIVINLCPILPLNTRTKKVDFLSRNQIFKLSLLKWTNLV